MRRLVLIVRNFTLNIISGFNLRVLVYSTVEQPMSCLNRLTSIEIGGDIYAILAQLRTCRASHLRCILTWKAVGFASRGKTGA